MRNDVAVQSLPSVVWRDTKVITTELLASLYGAEVQMIRNNYSRNANRFATGKHFFKVEGDELTALKKNNSLRGVVQKGAKHAILWTERGAARHAKMLETDAAWDVFEALEDHYFRAKIDEAEIDGAELSTVRDREPLLHAAVAMVVKHRFPFNIVYQTMNHFAGSARFSVMTKEQVGEVANFVERLLIGNDTRQDWARIEANRKELLGIESQPELAGFIVPGTLASRIRP